MSHIRFNVFSISIILLMEVVIYVPKTAFGSPQSNWALDTSSFQDALNGQSYEETFGSIENGYEQSYGGAGANSASSEEDDDTKNTQIPTLIRSRPSSNTGSSGSYQSKTSSVRSLESTRAIDSRVDENSPSGYGRRKSSLTSSSGAAITARTLPSSSSPSSGSSGYTSSSASYSSSGNNVKKADQRFFVDNPVVTTPIDGLVNYGGRGDDRRDGGVLVETLPRTVPRRRGGGGGGRRTYGTNGGGSNRRRVDEETVRRRTTDTSSSVDGQYFPTTGAGVPNPTTGGRRRTTSTPSVVYGSRDDERVDDRRTTTSVGSVDRRQGVDRRVDYDYSGVTTRRDDTGVTRREDYEYDYDGDSKGLEAYGKPGEDFPIFSRVPNTGFSCRSRMPGYYADVRTGCQVFYICQADGRQDGFLCPNATLFNQELFVCDYWNHVDCTMAESFYTLNGNLFQVTGCGESACGGDNSGYGSRTGSSGTTQSDYGVDTVGQTEVNARLTAGNTNSPYSNRARGSTSGSSLTSTSSTGSGYQNQGTSTSASPFRQVQFADQSGYGDMRQQNSRRGSSTGIRRYAK